MALGIVPSRSAGGCVYARLDNPLHFRERTPSHPPHRRILQSAGLTSPPTPPGITNDYFFALLKVGMWLSGLLGVCI